MTTCPYCKKQFNPIEAMMDDEWIEIIQLLPEFGGHGRLIFEYLELFGVNPVRLKSKRILRLLKQIKSLFDNGEFAFKKSRYRISRAGIIEALTITCNKHFATPLEDHNYLKKVMITISEKEATEKSVETEKALKKKETRLMNAHREGDIEEGLTLAEWKKRKGE